VAFIAYAAPDAGPIAIFGHEDTKDDPGQAWVQLPVHAALAIALAVGRPSGPRWLARAVGVAGIGLLAMWMTLLTIAVLSALGDYTDSADVLACVSLLLLYGGALYLTLRIKPVSTRAA
jgi:hypothetical protein